MNREDSIDLEILFVIIREEYIHRLAKYTEPLDSAKIIIEFDKAFTEGLVKYAKKKGINLI